METLTFIAILGLGTLVAVLVLALVSKRRTEQRRHDPEAPKSSLAPDGPDHRRAD